MGEVVASSIFSPIPMSIKQTATRLKNITVQKQLKKLEEIIQETNEVVLDLNRGQLMQGVDASGLSLGSYKSEWYAKMKRTLNPRGVVDLKLTGSFHDNFFVASEVPLIIFSYDEKASDLVAKYGKEIFGLTEDSRKVYLIGYVRPRFAEFQKELLGL